MGKVLLGDDYLVWIRPAGAPAFLCIDGQGSLTDNRSQTKINTSSKNKRGYNTSAFGNKDVAFDLDIIVFLPDPGFTGLETSCNASPAAPFDFQVRGGGPDGVDADKIFESSVYGSISSRNFAQDGAVTAKAAFVLADAPTFDTLS